MNKQTINRLSSIADRLALSFSDVETLARIERTLSRWAERECGDSNDYASFWIETDGDGKAWQIVQRHAPGAKQTKTRVPNREKGALARLDAFCQLHGLHFYHQQDPRGTMLYVAREPIPANDYTKNGIPVSF